MTRAQGLLYVVGDPAVLGLDPLWRGFLNYVHQNGGWRGGDIPWDPNALTHGPDGEGGDDLYAEQMREMGVKGMEEFAKRIREATKGDVEEDGIGEETEAGVEMVVLREQE